MQRSLQHVYQLWRKLQSAISTLEDQASLSLGFQLAWEARRNPFLLQSIQGDVRSQYSLSSR
jgi:hypothetical protein